MQCQAGWPMPIFSPVSSRSSSSSQYGDLDVNRNADYCGSTSDMGDDALGLKGLINMFYAPQLEAELERLFCHPEKGRGSPDSLSPTYNSKSVWDDFQSNGQDRQLDDLDKLFRGMASSISSLATAEMNGSVGQSDSSEPPSPPLESDSTDIIGAPLSLKGPSVQEIITKAHLIDILREREHLQRSTRNIKRVVVSGGGLLSSTSVGMTKTPTSKSATGKVCVFCRNNGEPEAVYTSHQLKDPEGNVTCPILYIYTCPICGANGKQSHTIKYCPYNTGDSLVTAKQVMKSTTSLTQHSSVLLKRALPLM